MRFLIVGAGAMGGYFGGRLLEKGEDVTFLVRSRRAAELAQNGLAIKSKFGDVIIPNPPHVLSSEIDQPFDLVIVACKAYDLPETIESFAKAVGPQTAVLPLLNGMDHLRQLATRFGPERILGGHCLISAALDAQHVIVHLNDTHTLGFGELDGTRSPRIESLTRACEGAKFTAHASSEIVQEMWEKWVFIASAAGITCLMRSAFGDIVAAGAAALTLAMYDECEAIATHAGFPPRPAPRERVRTLLTTSGSTVTASMLKDIERGARTEADHILGDLLRRAGTAHSEASLLNIAYAHLKAYAARRHREGEALARA
ncbi:MAG: 2-dehydropantoate 2-reductase [Burkholderiaceae bacterium]|jgi:2-dehydropantoate 2-reductase